MTAQLEVQLGQTLQGRSVERIAVVGLPELGQGLLIVAHVAGGVAHLEQHPHGALVVTLAATSQDVQQRGDLGPALLGDVEIHQGFHSRRVLGGMLQGLLEEFNGHLGITHGVLRLPTHASQHLGLGLFALDGLGQALQGGHHPGPVLLFNQNGDQLLHGRSTGGLALQGHAVLGLGGLGVHELAAKNAAPLHIEAQDLLAVPGDTDLLLQGIQDILPLALLFVEGLQQVQGRRVGGIQVDDLKLHRDGSVKVGQLLHKDLRGPGQQHHLLAKPRFDGGVAAKNLHQVFVAFLLGKEALQGLHRLQVFGQQVQDLTVVVGRTVGVVQGLFMQQGQAGQDLHAVLGPGGEGQSPLQGLGQLLPVARVGVDDLQPGHGVQVGRIEGQDIFELVGGPHGILELVLQDPAPGQLDGGLFFGVQGGPHAQDFDEVVPGPGGLIDLAQGLHSGLLGGIHVQDLAVGLDGLGGVPHPAVQTLAKLQVQGGLAGEVSGHRGELAQHGGQGLPASQRGVQLDQSAEGGLGLVVHFQQLHEPLDGLVLVPELVPAQGRKLAHQIQADQGILGGRHGVLPDGLELGVESGFHGRAFNALQGGLVQGFQFQGLDEQQEGPFPFAQVLLVHGGPAAVGIQLLLDGQHLRLVRQQLGQLGPAAHALQQVFQGPVGLQVGVVQLQHLATAVQGRVQVPQVVLINGSHGLEDLAPGLPFHQRSLEAQGLHGLLPGPRLLIDGDEGLQGHQTPRLQVQHPVPGLDGGGGAGVLVAAKLGQFGPQFDTGGHGQLFVHGHGQQQLSQGLPVGVDPEEGLEGGLGLRIIAVGAANPNPEFLGGLGIPKGALGGQGQPSVQAQPPGFIQIGAGGCPPKQIHQFLPFLQPLQKAGQVVEGVLVLIGEDQHILPAFDGLLGLVQLVLGEERDLGVQGHALVGIPRELGHGLVQGQQLGIELHTLQEAHQVVQGGAVLLVQVANHPVGIRRPFAAAKLFLPKGAQPHQQLDALAGVQGHFGAPQQDLLLLLVARRQAIEVIQGGQGGHFLGVPIQDIQEEQLGPLRVAPIVHEVTAGLQGQPDVGVVGLSLPRSALKVGGHGLPVLHQFAQFLEGDQRPLILGIQHQGLAGPAQGGRKVSQVVRCDAGQPPGQVQPVVVVRGHLQATLQHGHHALPVAAVDAGPFQDAQHLFVPQPGFKVVGKLVHHLGAVRVQDVQVLHDRAGIHHAAQGLLQQQAAAEAQFQALTVVAGIFHALGQHGLQGLGPIQHGVELIQGLQRVQILREVPAQTAVFLDGALKVLDLILQDARPALAQGQGHGGLGDLLLHQGQHFHELARKAGGQGSGLQPIAKLVVSRGAGEHPRQEPVGPPVIRELLPKQGGRHQGQRHALIRAATAKHQGLHAGHQAQPLLPLFQHGGQQRKGSLLALAVQHQILQGVHGLGIPRFDLQDLAVDPHALLRGLQLHHPELPQGQQVGHLLGAGQKLQFDLQVVNGGQPVFLAQVQILDLGQHLGVSRIRDQQAPIDLLGVIQTGQVHIQNLGPTEQFHLLELGLLRDGGLALQHLCQLRKAAQAAQQLVQIGQGHAVQGVQLQDLVVDLGGVLFPVQEVLQHAAQLQEELAALLGVRLHLGPGPQDLHQLGVVLRLPEHGGQDVQGLQVPGHELQDLLEPQDGLLGLVQIAAGPTGQTAGNPFLVGLGLTAAEAVLQDLCYLGLAVQGLGQALHLGHGAAIRGVHRQHRLIGVKGSGGFLQHVFPNLGDLHLEGLDGLGIALPALLSFDEFDDLQPLAGAAEVLVQDQQHPAVFVLLKVPLQHVNGRRQSGDQLQGRGQDVGHAGLVAHLHFKDPGRPQHELGAAGTVGLHLPELLQG